MLTSVQKALRVIDHLAACGPTGVSEIGRALDVTVGTAHRLVTTLVAEGYVMQHRDRRYGLSSKITELARQTRPAVGLVEVVHPYLEKLMSRCGETVNLGVFRDSEVIYVDRVVTDQMMAFSVRVGTRVPAFSTALGRAILAFVDTSIRDAYFARLSQVSAEKGSVSADVDKFRRVLRTVETRGYSEEDGEFVDEIACVAAPVFDGRKRPAAAVSISGPRSRIRGRRTELIEMVRQATQEISLELDARGEQVEL